MKKYTTGLLLILILGISGSICAATEERGQKAQANWTFIVHMEADNNLNDFAIKNLYDMAKIEPGNNNILVQWIQPREKGTWRYRVKKQRVELDAHLPPDAHQDCVKLLVDGVRWAKEKYPADHYAVVLWNHGVGILDPIWGNQSGQETYYDGLSTTFKMKDIYKNALSHRGILFNETSKTYMNNQQLAESFRQINQILGKKIDIVGMDACLMAGVETAYQIAPYAQTLVSSEDVELADGWYYSEFMRDMSENTMDTFEVAQSIVLAFDAYYKNKTPYFTQSAVNLAHMDEVRDSLNHIVKAIGDVKKDYPSVIRSVIQKARRDSLQFETPSYIDLYTFYDGMYKQLGSTSFKISDAANPKTMPVENRDLHGIQLCDTYLPANYFATHVTRSEQIIEEELLYDELLTQTRNLTRYMKEKPEINTMLPKDVNDQANTVENLKAHLLHGMKLIDAVVIANACGKGMNRAKGLSIYYPCGRIDKSYLRTNFVRDSLWLEFLQDNI